jgi:hypothetical protein
MIQMTRQGIVQTGGEAALAPLRERFQQKHCLLLREFLHRDLASFALPLVGHAEYRPKHYDRVGSELLMEPNAALSALLFLANDPRLFSFVRNITNCAPIGYFHGRIYKLVPNADHAFAWHDDLHEASRLVAMSINLSAETYRGGLLQIRETTSRKVVGKVSNTGSGDAVIFRISPELEHCVDPLEEGSAPRISLAGWFRSGPNFHDALRQSHESNHMGMTHTHARNSPM